VFPWERVPGSAMLPKYFLPLATKAALRQLDWRSSRGAAKAQLTMASAWRRDGVCMMSEGLDQRVGSMSGKK